MAQAIFPPQLPPLPPSKRIALKVDVETYRGTTEGVPRLIEVFRRHGAGATFLFTFGAPRTVAALLRAGTRAVRKLGGHSLLAHYGVRALLHGTVLPAPDIGRRCADVMRRVRDEGFEVGIHAWDSARWRRGASAADAAWTARQMKRAADRFHDIFGQPARVHGAAGWQMNVHAYRQTQRLGFDYCSDTRGTHPFIPVVNAELIACPQVPTTLPGLMQLLARDGMDAQRAADELLAAARASNAPAGHVYTLHADFEGRKLLPLFEQVLSAWRAAGIALIALGDYLQAHGGELPRHSVHAGPADDILGRVALQGPEFLG